jgi:hypothetical protein
MPNLQEQLTTLQAQVDAIASFLIGDPEPAKKSKGWSSARRKAHGAKVKAGLKSKKGDNRVVKNPTAKKK